MKTGGVFYVKINRNVIPLRLAKMSYLWKFMNYGLIVFVQIDLYLSSASSLKQTGDFVKYDISNPKNPTVV